jgi:hypothetical protein
MHACVDYGLALTSSILFGCRLEQAFWDRDSLAHIHDSALMRMTPPWGVLAHCAARVLTIGSPAWRRRPAADTEPHEYTG